MVSCFLGESVDENKEYLLLYSGLNIEYGMPSSMLAVKLSSALVVM